MCSPRAARVAASASPSSSAPAFVRAARLRRNADIAAVRSQGTELRHRLFGLRARPNGMDEIRIAVSTPRSLGRAVARNRARRRLREAFRVAIRAAGDGKGHDLVVVVRAPIASASHEALREAAAAAIAGLARS